MFSLELALHYLQGSFSPEHSAEQPWQEGVCSWPSESLGAASSPVSGRSQVRAYNPHIWGVNPFWILWCFNQKWAFTGHVCWMPLFNGHSAAPSVGLGELMRPDVCQTAACWKWDISTSATNHMEKCPVLDRNTNAFRFGWKQWAGAVNSSEYLDACTPLNTDMASEGC